MEERRRGRTGRYDSKLFRKPSFLGIIKSQVAVTLPWVVNVVTSKESLPTETEEEKTSFIICNEDKSWFMLKSETMDGAISQAKNRGKEPRYAVEEKLCTSTR